MRSLKKYIYNIVAVMLSAVFMITACSCSGKSLDSVINDVANMGNGLGSAALAEGAPDETFPEGTRATDASDTVTGQPGMVAALTRKQLIGTFVNDSAITAQASVSEPGISNYSEAVNSGAYPMTAESETMILQNKFIVSDTYTKEFYQIYENNRYMNRANFVTVDSMMHAYHLYFAYLLKQTERYYLSDLLLYLSESMIEQSRAQYDELAGTEWEEAALLNIAFFTVGAVLLNENEYIDERVADTVNTELSCIYDASYQAESALCGTTIDYSQFKPRGYYEGDAGLEKYFRAMMWYGQIGFSHKYENLDRSALLINLALDNNGFELWEEIYSVTSFFAGASDDLTYYEIMPAIWEAYGEGATTSSIIGANDKWETFESLIDSMPSPAINSVSTYDNGGSAVEPDKGYRFMGQRFSLDEAVFQRLINGYTGENPDGAVRMLPDTLDVAAAFGSDTAYSLLETQGDTRFENYTENMQVLKDSIENADEAVWGASLYSSWLYTLKPLLDEKGDGYPEFMQGREWAKKDIETFAGSYAELKHDTILYAKQAVAEMGGDEIPNWDTRGYVEPEAEVWARFEALARATAAGLSSYGLIESDDSANLNELADMAAQFKEISVKELAGELLNEDEYEAIEYFGGNLEHLWKAALSDMESPIIVDNYPSPIIADVATGDGTCLEVATGCPSKITVLVYFDGAYHVCSGAMYSFYQFEQPSSNRLTDSQWRQMMGYEMTGSGGYDRSGQIDKPWWTMSYRTIGQ